MLTTLVMAPGETLADALTSLARIAEELQLCREAGGYGVEVELHDGDVRRVLPDFDLEAGQLSYIESVPLQPWLPSLAEVSWLNDNISADLMLAADGVVQMHVVIPPREW